MNKNYDIVIIGGGAAGFTSAIYTARRGLKTLIISKDIGGQASLTCEIENYPGTGLIEGPELMKKFLDDAEKFGAEFLSGEVTDLQQVEDNNFIITSDRGKFGAQAVVLAFGLTPRDLDVPGEMEFKHKGVSHTAYVEADKYTDKVVSVVGGGNSALITAIALADFAKTVHLIHRRDEFRGESVLIKRLNDVSNIENFLEYVPVKISGNEVVDRLTIESVNNSEDRKILNTSAVFVNVGFIANTSWLGELVEYSTSRHIVVDKKCQTKTPGLFAAGDVTDIDFKQVVVSAGEGAKAGLSAYEYLKANKGYKGSSIDWGLYKK